MQALMRVSICVCMRMFVRVCVLMLMLMLMLMHQVRRWVVPHVPRLSKSQRKSAEPKMP